MPSPVPRLSVGMPAFKSDDTLDETIRSIRAQTFAAFKVVCSVDGADSETAARLRELAHGDPRFEVHLQDRRLGWAGNMNWLYRNCDTELFCYWQQDDFCSDNYLSSLVAHLDAHPEAVCAYSDLQWFGTRSEHVVRPSQTGLALVRVLSQIEDLDYLPFRGVTRAVAIAGAGPIRETGQGSALEDLVWLCKLAREGELHRVEGPIYCKRGHSGSLHARWLAWPEEQRRAAWLEFGLGMLEVLLRVVPETDAEAAVDHMLDRLTQPKAGRWLLYPPQGPAGLASFVESFLDGARSRMAIAAAGRPPLSGAEASRGGTRQLIANAARFAAWRTEGLRSLARGFPVALHPSAGGDGEFLLDRGWLAPERWGVWSAERHASLRLPASWRMSLSAIELDAHVDAGRFGGRPTAMAMASIGGHRHPLVLRRRGLRRRQRLTIPVPAARTDQGADQAGDAVLEIDLSDLLGTERPGASESYGLALNRIVLHPRGAW